MEQRNKQSAKQIEAARDALAGGAVDRLYARRPELVERYGPAGRQKCVDDTRYTIDYLVNAVSTSQPALFTEYVAWAKVVLERRNVRAEDLADNLAALREAARELLPPEAAALAAEYLDAGIAHLPTVAAEPPGGLIGGLPLEAMARAYLDALLAGRRNDACRIVIDAVDRGTPLRDVYVMVFQEAQYEIGRLWQMNRITVAQEHYCTAATQLIMSQLYPRLFATPRVGRRMVAACVSGELHEIGARMVADLLELEGWETFYLGASTPAASLVQEVADRRPDVLGISATLTPHVGRVAEIIRLVRAEPTCAGVKILVGGYPFRVAPGLWRDVGADGWAPDAVRAVEMVKSWQFEPEGTEADVQR